jgi:hypothetical protein
MTKYTVSLSEAEIRAMEHVCIDVDEWIQTAFRHRVMTAISGLSDLEMAKALKFKRDIITDREKLVEMSKEPPMSSWMSEDQYNPNPDNPFVNPTYQLQENDPE